MKAKRNNYGINPETGERFKSQREVIFHYLKEEPGRRITSLQAITDFGFTRLSDIIFRIEKFDGVRCSREDIIVPTRYGGGVRVTAYWFPQE